MLSHEDRILGEFLIARGIVDRNGVELCARDRQGQESLTEVLARRGLLSADQLRDLSDQVGRSAIHGGAGEVTGPGAKLGDFRLLREIGRGAMGIVYEAEQVSLGRRVALKVLPIGTVVDERRTVRFLREARAAASLSHPGIVPVHICGQAEGALYFAMELIDGPNLTEWKRQNHPSVVVIARMTRDIAAAMQYAHDKGFVHRDLKPDNILIDRDGSPRIVDFGLVHEPGSDRITLPDGVIGTPAFMAPEQARGEPIEAAADVYGIGAILYFMLTGRPPFSGTSAAAVIAQVARDRPQPVLSIAPDVPSVLAAMADRALSFAPTDRPPSAAALVADLDRVLEQLVEPSGSGSRTTPPRSRRSPWLRWGLVAVVVAGVVLVAATTLQRHQPPTVASDTPLPPSQLPLRRVHLGSGPPIAPSLSPDGKWLAYAVRGTQPTGHNVELNELGTNHTVQLASGGDVAFAPDGVRLAVAAATIEIRRVDGTRISHFTESGTDLAWSPDGREIGFIEIRSRGSVYGPIRSLDVATGVGRSLSGIPARSITWSPGGQRLAFVSPTGGRSDLWSIAASGGEPLRLTNDPANDWSPVWATSGMIYFGSDRDGRPGLWRILVDQVSGAPLGSAERVSDAPLWCEFELAVSADGDRLALSGCNGWEAVVTLSFDPELREVVGSPAILRADLGGARSPDPAPSTGVVAYSALRDESLALVYRDGRRALLGGAPSRDRSPRWSPDGSSLVFHSDRDGSWQLWQLAVHDGAPKQLTHVAAAAGAVWSPDGRRVAFSLTREGAAAQGAVLDLDSGRVEQLPTGDPQGFEPGSWSRDGRRLAGTANGIVIHQLSDGRYVRLTAAGEQPSWLPDDRHLLFIQDNALWVVDRDTGDHRQLYDAEPYDLTGYGLRRDGREICVSLQSTPGDLLLLDLRQLADTP